MCPEYTPIRSDIEAYASRLEAAGVPTKSSIYEGMLMGLVGMAGFIDAGRTTRSPRPRAALRSAFAD